MSSKTVAVKCGHIQGSPCRPGPAKPAQTEGLITIQNPFSWVHKSPAVWHLLLNPSTGSGHEWTQGLAGCGRPLGCLILEPRSNPARQTSRGQEQAWARAFGSVRGQHPLPTAQRLSERTHQDMGTGPKRAGLHHGVILPPGNHSHQVAKGFTGVAVENLHDTLVMGLCSDFHLADSKTASGGPCDCPRPRPGGEDNDFHAQQVELSHT